MVAEEPTVCERVAHLFYRVFLLWTFVSFFCLSASFPINFEGEIGI